jgi:hypothetical protein
MLNSGRPEFRCNPSFSQGLYAKMMDPRVKPTGDGSGRRGCRVQSTGIRFSSRPAQFQLIHPGAQLAPRIAALRGAYALAQTPSFQNCMELSPIGPGKNTRSPEKTGRKQRTVVMSDARSHAKPAWGGRGRAALAVRRLVNNNESTSAFLPQRILEANQDQNADPG